jgi:hypothetical protein
VAYCLPARDSDDAHPKSSPPSPTAHSDGELEAEKRSISKKAAARLKVDVLAKSRKETKMKTTAPYGDLLKCAFLGISRPISLINICSLVSLQAVLEDTQEQLQEVQERCDRLIEEDVVGMLVSAFGGYVDSTLTPVQRREVSERQEQVRWLREQEEVLRARATGSASLSMFPVALF